VTSYLLFFFLSEQETCGHRVNRSNTHLVYIRTINFDSSKPREEKLHVIYLLRESNKKNGKKKSSRFEYCSMFIVIAQLVFTLSKKQKKRRFEFLFDNSRCTTNESLRKKSIMVTKRQNVCLASTI